MAVLFFLRPHLTHSYKLNVKSVYLDKITALSRVTTHPLDTFASEEFLVTHINPKLLVSEWGEELKQ